MSFLDKSAASPRQVRARTRAFQGVCLAVVAFSTVGLYLQSPRSADAAASTSSAITVNWAGDTSAAQALQPVRSTASAHYQALKNISVTLAQSVGLGDQAVNVKVAGFAPTKSATDFAGQNWTSAMNFMQAMQCWGDPTSATFNQTCEWGARYVANNGLGNSVYSDNVMRVPSVDMAPKASVVPAASDPLDVPFEVVDSTTAKPNLVTGHQVFAKDAAGRETKTATYPLLDYYSASTTNEVQSARIAADGSGSFDFETQNSDDAPQMGCGTAAHLTCYLVLVPRDSIYGGHDESCSSILDNSFTPYAYSRANSIQAGSPVNPACDYWNNRIVIPLAFNPTGSSCTQGNTERRLIGSQLLVGAMASWQPKLCNDFNTTFSFATNPDAVAREQLIKNQAGLAFGSAPVVASELGDATKGALATTDLSYAPVAVTSAVFAYQAEGPNGRINSLNLSPRLVAKLLTQSYVFTVPSNSSDPASNFLHLGSVNRGYTYWNQDPDFQALNSNWKQFTSNPAIILPGPAGADVIAQLWKWIDADADAAAWLGGSTDPWGMTVNPYYLPLGNPAAVVPTFTKDGALARTIGGSVADAVVGLSNIDGTPMKIGTVLQNTFIKADASLVPLALGAIRYPFGSSQFAPYVDDFVTAARNAFRADPGSKTVWDSTAINSSGDVGAWVSGGAQIPGSRFTIAFTDAASARRYNLNAAALQLDNLPSQTIAPTDESLTHALATSLVATSNSALSQVSPSIASPGSYPLTTIVYAAVNLSGSDAAARHDYSRLILDITTTGQIPGVQVGQLPPGYVPLTAAQVTQAATAAEAIAAYVPPAGAPAAVVVSPAASSAYAQDDYTAPVSSAGSSTGGSAGVSIPSQSTPPEAAAVVPSVTTTVADAVAKTPRSSASPIAQGALLGSLGSGVAGALFAPSFFRRRRIR